MTTALQQYNVANYTALFVAFVAGSSLETVADEFQVSFGELQKVARAQRWTKLALRVQAQLDTPHGDEQRIVKLQSNRETNLQQAEMARHKLDVAFEACSLYCDAPIAPAVIKDLVSAMATVHDLTYRALGDKDKQQHAGQGSAPTNEIHFHLPGAISKPRDERVIELSGPPPPPPPPIS